MFFSESKYYTAEEKARFRQRAKSIFIEQAHEAMARAKSSLPLALAVLCFVGATKFGYRMYEVGRLSDEQQAAQEAQDKVWAQSKAGQFHACARELESIAEVKRENRQKFGQALESGYVMTKKDEGYIIRPPLGGIFIHGETATPERELDRVKTVKMAVLRDCYRKTYKGYARWALDFKP